MVINVQKMAQVCFRITIQVHRKYHDSFIAVDGWNENRLQLEKLGHFFSSSFWVFWKRAKN